ncbi:hypothetical protein [Novosphingobium album (ex Hu et al. 2023)]|uniref:Sulfotransferase n=1 Tax=Novosphingobium album (ex Hu et al. 2023) TaxID=2930093 RepID=A0ABT0B6D9_9SPHN|nr:hypothetical protein [Novosphingobium album (ex Hu et al. 2023)]MCJ2180435.1 hypothetical protein [Novosphingobium album (ex Hu et al. 2023)]
MACQSILILTHHKAASTLLRRILLASPDPRYKVVDYAGTFWKTPEEQKSWSSVYEKLNEDPGRFFKATEHIYGPLRDAVDIDPMGFRRVIIARDPVRTLESEYVSFAHTHPEPEGGKARAAFMERRETMKALTADEYALEAMPRLFKRFTELHEVSDGALILPYEMLIRHRKDTIRRYHRFAGIRVPVALTLATIALLEMKPSVAVHRSRDTNFANVKLTPAVREEIEAKFAPVSSIYLGSE